MAQLDRDLEVLVQEAAAWRLLGLLLERPRGAWWHGVEDLAREVGAADVAEAARSAAQEADEGVYLALLGPGGPASPREVSHAPLRQPGQLLAELQAFYRAFEYRPVTEEPPDHVAVQAGFVGYLRLKEAFARATGAMDAADVTRWAAQRFVAGHLAVIAEPLSEALAISAEGSYLELAARALVQRTGPSPEPKLRPPVEAEGCGFECGTAGPA